MPDDSGNLERMPIKFWQTERKIVEKLNDEKEDNIKNYWIKPLMPDEYAMWQSGDMSWLKPYMTLIPCGHCIGCKLDHSREWADRMLCELQSAQGKGIFVTLTYEDPPKSTYVDNNGIEHRNYTLKVKDLQDFIKRVRRAFDGTTSRKVKYTDDEGVEYMIPLPEKRIRFYAAGEYGEMRFRPHYHVIFFGIDVNDVFCVPALAPDGSPVKNDFGDLYYNSTILEDLWKSGKSDDCVRGHVMCGECTWKSCAYVARYVTKKWSSGYGIYRNRDGSVVDLYKMFNVQPEFSTMSLKPGIGSEYFDTWHDQHPNFDMMDFQKISLRDGTEGKTIRVPKYFRKKFKDSPEEELREKYRIYVERAVKSAESRIKLDLSRTDREYIEYLSVQEVNHTNGAKKLRRNKI